MWYFAWVLGIGFAVLLAILNALWGENEEARAAARHAADHLPDICRDIDGKRTGRAFADRNEIDEILC